MFCGFAVSAQSLKEDVSRLKKSNDEVWYADSSFAFTPKDSLELSKQSSQRIKVMNPELVESILKVVGYGIGFAILAGLIYAIYSFKINKRPTKDAPISTDEEEDTESIENADELYKIDFQRKINQAEDNSNYRLAVRYYFLWTLQDLSKRGLIKYEKNKTNHQYAEDLKNHKKGTAFKTAAKYYNFVWYGEYSVPLSTYEKIASHFKTMLA